MNIRKVELSEITGVLDVIDEFNREKSIRPSTLELSEIYTSLINSGGCVVGAFDDDKIIGSCTLNICPNFSWSGRPYANVENVIVSKSERGKGIGKALLNFAKDYAKEFGCYKITLSTGSKKPETLQFYESVGFSGNKTCFQIRFTDE